MDITENIRKRFNVTSNMKHIQIRGYGRNDLATFFGELGFTTGAEIGTEAGKYARVLCGIPGLHLTCVDPWELYDENRGYKEGYTQEMHNRNYEDAKELLKGFNVDFRKQYAHDAVSIFPDESLDFVYIDGNHRLEYVVQDLTDWTPKVKKGGIVAGHDFIKQVNQRYSHVPYALEAYLQSYGGYPIYVLDQKDKVRTDDDRYDRIRSWFFVRP